MKSFRVMRLHSLLVAFCSALCALGSLYGQAAQILVYDGGHDDRAQAVATDANGSLFVAGHSNVDGTLVTFAVLKYNAIGSLQWLARAQGLGDYIANSANDVATDQAGNVYAVGYASRPLPFQQTDFGWLIASFDSNGLQRWAQVFNGPGNSRDFARNVVVDPLRGVYVVGTTQDAAGSTEWLTIKYSFTGVEQWRRIEAGPPGSDDQPIAIKVDRGGNVIILGHVQSGNVSSPKDVRLVQYDPQGNVNWRASYSDTVLSDESPQGLALDANDNIYVVADRGVSTNPELPSTPITLKYDSHGSLMFVLAGPGRGGSAVAVDSAGNFVVSGVSFDDAGSNQMLVTSKFTPQGALLWSLPFFARHLAIDEVDGSVYLTKGFSGIVAAKVSPAGQIVWEQTVPGGDLPNDAIVDDATGDFIVTGNSQLGHGDMITARFTADSTPQLPPTAPSALTASAKRGAIDLSWTDNSSDETGFLIERSVNGATFVQIAQVGANVRNFSNSGLNKRNTYSYRVRAFNNNGNSNYTNTVTSVPR